MKSRPRKSISLWKERFLVILVEPTSTQSPTNKLPEFSKISILIWDNGDVLKLPVTLVYYAWHSVNIKATKKAKPFSSLLPATSYHLIALPLGRTVNIPSTYIKTKYSKQYFFVYLSATFFFSSFAHKNSFQLSQLIIQNAWLTLFLYTIPLPYVKFAWYSSTFYLPTYMSCIINSVDRSLFSSILFNFWRIKYFF